MADLCCCAHPWSRPRRTIRSSPTRPGSSASTGRTTARAALCQANQMGKPGKPLTIGSTVLGVADVARARGFWTAALGYLPRDAEPGDAAPDNTWTVLVPADGAGAQLSLMLSDTPPQDRPRVHLDLYAADQAAEISRLTGLGARVV